MNLKKKNRIRSITSFFKLFKIGRSQQLFPFGIKKKMMLIAGFLSFGAIGQISVADSMDFYVSQYEKGEVTLVELDNSLARCYNTLPKDQQLTGTETWNTEAVSSGTYLITVFDQSSSENYGTQKIMIQH